LRDVAKMNRYLNLAMFVGFPSFTVFNVSAYRRFLATPPFYKELNANYAYEISKDLKKD
jgi:hypothetical protein